MLMLSPSGRTAYIDTFVIRTHSSNLYCPPPGAYTILFDFASGRHSLCLCFHILLPHWYFIILDLVFGRIACAPLFGFRAVSLCLNILSAGSYPCKPDQISCRIPNAYILGMRPVKICFYFLPPGE